MITDDEALEFMVNGSVIEQSIGHVNGKHFSASQIHYSGTRSVPDLMVAFIPSESEWVLFVEDYEDEDGLIKKWKRATIDYNVDYF